MMLYYFSSDISWWHKGHLSHSELLCLFPNLHMQLRACLGQLRPHIRHPNRLLQARAEDAAGHLTNHLAACIQDFSMLPNRGTLGDKATSSPARLGDGPEQHALHRGGGVIKVVAIQTQTSLQPQTVPGTKPHSHHFLLRKQSVEDGQCALSWDRDLHSVLTGVTTAGDKALHTCNCHCLACHELHCCHVLWGVPLE